MTARFFLRAFILSFCSFAFILPSQAWTLTPMKIERTLRPGESVTDVLVVDNAGASESKRFELKLVDWSLDRKGDLIYSEPGQVKDSLAQHIVCSPMQFRCAPGERKLIRYTLSCPADLGPGEHTVGIQALEVIIPSKDTGSGRINVGVAVKCGFLCAMSIMVPGIEAKALEALSLNFVPGQASRPASIDLSLKNDGNTRARPKWSFQLFDQTGKKVGQDEAGDYLILRQSERLISCPIKAELPPGKYRLQGKLDQGLPYPVQELEKEFEVLKATPGGEQSAGREDKP